MSPEEFKNKMSILHGRLSDTDDIEVVHQEADCLLCELLNDLGYHEGVELFARLQKHYQYNWFKVGE